MRAAFLANKVNPYLVDHDGIVLSFIAFDEELVESGSYPGHSY